MNALSWLIYAADVAGTLNFWATAIAVVGAPAAIVAFAWVSNYERSAWDELMRDHLRYPSVYAKPEGERPEPRQPFASYAVPLVAVSICAGLVAVAVPARETIYAIAASEMGEEIVKSETAGKAMRALNAWLDKQIATQGGN